MSIRSIFTMKNQYAFYYIKDMKILIFSGGLGNQIFEYAFYKHLKEIFPNQRFYGHYGKKLTEHYGLEIDKWFDIELPPEKWWTFPVVVMFYFYKQVFVKSKWLDLNQREWKNRDAIVYFPFKFTNAYFPNDNNWLMWKVDESTLNEKNKETLQYIRRTNSCFIHVRRGDYLSPRFKSIFEGCCTEDYYRRAIAYMNENVENVRFICFSDDQDWVREKLPLDKNTIFIDWNTGTDSPLDMYLMSQCNNGIIANSTFSYWGAYLGKKKNYVIYPCKWWNLEEGNPSIFWEGWKKM